MLLQIKNWLNRKFPQNFVIRKPLAGALIISLVSLLFVLLYQPLGAHPGKFLGFELTMLAYVLAGGLLVFVLVKGLKTIPFFSDEQEWTILKELAAIVLLLFGFGVAVYFTAFFIEEPADRWNFSTFFDSLSKASLIAIIPLGFQPSFRAIQLTVHHGFLLLITRTASGFAIGNKFLLYIPVICMFYFSEEPLQCRFDKLQKTKT